MQGLADDLGLGLLLAGFLVRPAFLGESAFDVDRAAFGEVFLGEFGEFAPEGDADEGDFLLFVALVIARV